MPIVGCDEIEHHIKINPKYKQDQYFATWVIFYVSKKSF